MRTTKAHISLRVRAVWSASLLFAAYIVYNTSSFYIQNFKPLFSLCNWAGRFVSYLVGNPRRHVILWRGSIILCLCIFFLGRLIFVDPRLWWTARTGRNKGFFVFFFHNINIEIFLCIFRRVYSTTCHLRRLRTTTVRRQVIQVPVTVGGEAVTRKYITVSHSHTGKDLQVVTEHYNLPSKEGIPKLQTRLHRSVPLLFAFGSTCITGFVMLQLFSSFMHYCLM